MTTNPIAPWLKRLHHRFSPRRILVGRESNHPLEGGGSRSLVCFVSRGLCLFMRVDAGKAAPRDRRRLVELAVRRAAPFPDPDFGVAWDVDGQAAVWYWSRARLLALLAERGVAAQDAGFVPEALHVRGGDGSEDGVELLQLSDGFCGRCWRDGRLLMERWWPAPPDTAAWRTFLRGSGLQDPPDAVPAPLPAPIQPKPWSAAARRAPAFGNLSGLDIFLPRVALGAGLVVAAIAAMQVGSIGRSHLDIWSAQRAGESLDEPLKRILAAREASDRNGLGIQQLLALRPAPASLSLIAETGQLLPGRDWAIKRWNQPVPGKVEVTVSLPSADPSALVAAWEASPLFTNVTTDVLGRGGDVTIRADVVTGTTLLPSP